jgi:hypothetical protein
MVANNRIANVTLNISEGKGHRKKKECGERAELIEFYGIYWEMFWFVVKKDARVQLSVLLFLLSLPEK